MKVLSLFDGMSCGQIAMNLAGVEVEKYVAFEIDKFAIQTSQHNFPHIDHRGDVFKADFTEFAGFDFLVGGSPCTYWSIAQCTDKCETTASGMGWELFSQYVRALHEAKPKYFIYENNKSMSKDIRASIDETFGFEAVHINSALVSAQNRNRLYWVGRRNADGTYSKVEVPQPADRGIVLRDILDGGAHTEIGSYAEKQIGKMVDELGYLPEHSNLWNRREIKDKSPTLTTQCGNITCHGTVLSMYPINEAEPINKPVYIGETPDNNGNYRNGKQPSQQYRVYSPDGKSVSLNTCSLPNVPIRVGCFPSPDGTLKNAQAQRIYSTDGKSVNINAGAGGMGAKTGLYAVPCKVGEIDGGGQGYRIYSVDGKSIAQTAQSGGIGSNTGLYAIPAEAPQDYLSEAMVDYAMQSGTKNLKVKPELMQDKAKPITTEHNKRAGTTNYIPQNIDGIYCKITTDGSAKDAKPIYEVKDGQITIKGKQYPIKLKDGFYIIRKLSVNECKRLQTVPEEYEFPVSNAQAYKMLGNGWTCEVIKHLIECCLAAVAVKEEKKELKQMLLFEGEF